MKSVLGTILATVTLAASGAWASDPSFDCAKAGSGAEEAICASDGLAAMDRELARLYGLAAEGPNMSPDRLKHLQATQRGWIKGRDDCWKSDLGLKQCIAGEYALRIMEIRTGYADSRVGKGGSSGPYPYHCHGLKAPVSAVFVTAGKPMAALKWAGNSVALPQVPAGSGVRYGARSYELWAKGSGALFTTPEMGSMDCGLDSGN